MMSDTLRDMIETQADEVMARLKQCRDRREAVVQELLATYHANQSSVDPVTMAVLIYVLRSGASYPAITRMQVITAWQGFRRLLEGEINYERRVWTSYTITHDEPGENDQHVAWLELQREQNQFALSVQYLETDALGLVASTGRPVYAGYARRGLGVRGLDGGADRIFYRVAGLVEPGGAAVVS